VGKNSFTKEGSMAKKATTKKKAAPKKKAPAQKVNKSQAIRDYCEANPTVGPKETAAALTKQGIKVSTAFVSTIKTKAKKNKTQTPKRRGRPRKNAASSAKPASDKIALSSLLAAKKMAEQLGGVEKAQAALAALAKLQ
jgi:hypothetical protein